MSTLNIVFHKICDNPQNKWQVSPEYFLEIFNWCQINYPNFHIYFDDGYSLEVLKDYFREIGPLSTLAIVTDDIGKKNFFTWKQLKEMLNSGFKVASHTVSHPSLCVYDETDSFIVKTPSGGSYERVPIGKHLLYENNVIYQLVESKKTLEAKGFYIDEIVFPYGLYSEQTISILDRIGIYKFYATCDSALYLEGKIIPRVLIEGDISTKETIKCLIKVINESK